MRKRSSSNLKVDLLAGSTSKAGSVPLHGNSERLPRVVTISAEHTLDGTMEVERVDPKSVARAGPTVCPAIHEFTTARLDENTIRLELKHILTSKTFSRSVQMSNLLEWIVVHWLAGEADQLNGQHILTAVFHSRKPLVSSFDSTGRVYVGRLRALLERYYEGEGAASHVRLEIPVGKYIPSVYRKKLTSAGNKIITHPPVNTVMVLPFQNAGIVDPCTGPTPLEITDHLISRLTRSRALHVMSRISAFGSDVETGAKALGQHFGAHFIVEGTINRSQSCCELTVHLSETTHGYNLWTRHYPVVTLQLAALVKRIVQDLSRKIRVTSTH